MRNALSLCLFLFGLLALPTAGRGQASATADQAIRLQAYGMVSYVRPDYLGHVSNFGGTAGVTVNAFSFAGFEPGLDFRILGSHGSPGTGFDGNTTNQYVFSAGPRLQYDLGNFQPYAAFHLGYGKLVFTNSGDPNYTHDNSTVYAVVGGVDYRVSRSFSLRAEAEGQRWRLTPAAVPFHPVAVSLGVRYQLHLRNRFGPE